MLNNNMSDILNKTITVQSMEHKQTKTGKPQIKLKDENNLTYTIWVYKVDGTEGKASQALKALPNAVGLTLEISYKEDHGEWEGKPITYRTIIGIKEGSVIQPQTQELAPQPTGLEERIKDLELKVNTLWGAHVSKAAQTNTTNSTSSEYIKVEDIDF